MTIPTEPGAAPRDPLRPRQRAFVDEYLLDLNATQAAVRAGYKASAANRAGWRLLRLPAVKAALAEAMAARAARTRVTGDRVIEEYARLAFTDMRNFSEWGPDGMKLRPHTQLSAADAAAVAELAPVGAAGRARIKLHDKRPALDALARHLGLFGTGGDYRRVPYGSDIRTEAMARARAALKERIEKIIAERDEPAETKEEET